MSIDEKIIRRIADAETRLERLESQESRRLITDYDWLRGWKDDFLGDSLHEQYTAVSNGAGSGGALQNNAHGGIYRLSAAAVALPSNHALWLGDAADGFATLDADIGWVMIVRMKGSHTTTCVFQFGATDNVDNNRLQAGLDTAVSTNWLLQTKAGGGAINNVISAVAADTNPHWHVLKVYPIAGGLRQVDYFLDGTQIATTTVSVPTAAITPRVVCVTRSATAARYLDLDVWITIPMNLA